jgi:hypothetical protein
MVRFVILKQKKFKIAFKVFLAILWFGFCYFIIPKFIIRMLFPWQCKGIIKDINLNLFHIPAYILTAYFLKWWALLFGWIPELAQSVILKRNFGWQDILFNHIGIIIGVFIQKMNSIIKSKWIRYLILLILTVISILVILFAGGDLQGKAQ